MPSVNYWAILVCGLMTMPLGMLWYSTLFGNTFMRLIGMKKENVLKPEAKKEMQRGYIMTFISALVMAYILAIVLMAMGMVGVGNGMMAAFWLWLGFIVTTNIGGSLWERRPWGLYYINMGYYFVALLIMGAILAAWK